MSFLEKIRAAADTAGDVIDATSMAIAPQYARKRLEARREAIVLAGYDGASQRRRLRRWQGDSTSVNTESARAQGILRARARDLVQNNYWARRAVRTIRLNVVGPGIVPSTCSDDEVDRLIHAVCDRTALDVRGRMTLAGIQSLVMQAVVESGEAIVLRRRLSTSEMVKLGIPIPLQVQVLEADHLDASKNDIHNGNRIIQGVEYDSSDRPVAYWLFPEHPGDMAPWQSLESRRFDASDVIHVYDEWRPGQVRGLPWLSTVIVKLHDWADYDDAQLMRQKVAATWAGFVTASDMTDRPLFDPDGLPERASPGAIEYLRPGEDIRFASPPGVDGFEEYSRVSARAIAAGLDITYEALTGDYSRVNFTSGRMGWLEMRLAVEQWQSQLLIPQFCYRVEEWIKEAALLVGVRCDHPWDWTCPRRPMLDPHKETMASIHSIRAGLSSLSQEIRERGRDPDDVMEEIARDHEKSDSLDLILDSDPRKVSSAGQWQTDFEES